MIFSKQVLLAESLHSEALEDCLLTQLYNAGQALMLLCEYVLNSTRAPPSEALLFSPLQLYLVNIVSDKPALEGLHTIDMGLYLHCRPQALMLLCEYVLNSTRAPPSEALLFHTLLQLYLAESPLDEQDDQSMAATSETTRRCVPAALWPLRFIITIKKGRDIGAGRV